MNASRIYAMSTADLISAERHFADKGDLVSLRLVRAELKRRPDGRKHDSAYVNAREIETYGRYGPPIKRKPYEY